MKILQTLALAALMLVSSAASAAYLDFNSVRDGGVVNSSFQLVYKVQDPPLNRALEVYLLIRDKETGDELFAMENYIADPRKSNLINDRVDLNPIIAGREVTVTISVLDEITGNPIAGETITLLIRR